MKNVTKLTVPLQLETAGGDLTLDTIGDLLCGGIVCHGLCVQSPALRQSFSAQPEVRKIFFCGRCPERYGVLKGPKGNVKLERSGGLDYLDVLGSVDGVYCRTDNVDIDHLRGGHLEFHPGVHEMHVHDDERTAKSSTG